MLLLDFLSFLRRSRSFFIDIFHLHSLCFFILRWAFFVIVEHLEDCAATIHEVGVVGVDVLLLKHHEVFDHGVCGLQALE